jgi:hypothetical protein
VLAGRGAGAAEGVKSGIFFSFRVKDLRRNPEEPAGKPLDVEQPDR